METSLEGLTINGFQFLKKIAVGSHSTIWKCVSEETKLKVVSKVFEKKKLSPFQILNVRNEINILKSVNNPLIVTFICSYETKHRIFIFEEYLKNGNLKEYIEAKTFLNEIEARKYFSEILLVIEYLQNEKKLFYRNLNVENIMLDSNYNPRLIGFGSCVSLSDNEEEEVKMFSDMSFGSIEYYPPEMLKNLEYSKDTDLWCLGILLFKMVTGRMPFTGENEQQISDNIAYKDPVFPSYLSNYLKDFLQKMLNKNPLSRLNLSTIKKHIWFSITEFLIIARLNQKSGACEPEIMNSCSDYNLDINKLAEQIEKNEYGSERIIYQQVKIMKKDNFIKDVIEGKMIKRKTGFDEENNSNLSLGREKSLPLFQIHHKTNSNSLNASLIYEQNNSNTFQKKSKAHNEDEKVQLPYATPYRRKITLPKNIPVSFAVKKTPISKNLRSLSFYGNDKVNLNDFPTIQ